MFPLGFGLLALILLLQSLPILLVEIVGEAGIGLDLLITVAVLAWLFAARRGEIIDVSPYTHYSGTGGLCCGRRQDARWRGAT